MPIFLAPSEVRKGTRLPRGVIKNSSILPRLEEWTGADLLLSPISTPKMEWLTTALPHQLALKRHCEVGELVQRKTGRDLSSSVPDFNHILYRMMNHCKRARLLFIGELSCDRKGMAIIDGGETNIRYSAVIGAIDAWQDHGGYYTQLSDDNRMVPWLNGRLNKLREAMGSAEKMLLPRPPARPLISGYDDYEVNAVAAFSTCQEIGPKKGLQLIEHCGSIAWAMKVLSEMKPGELPGFGKKTIEAARKWMFRDEDMTIEMISREEKNGK